MSDVGGDVLGYNMFAYCFNNPVNMFDSLGNWPTWNDIKKVAKKAVEKVVEKVVEVIVKPIEAQIGIGQGIGINVSRNVVAEFSKDTYIGIDDGKRTTGNIIVSEVSVLDSKMKLGDTYNHRVEENGQRVSTSGKLRDGPFDMINYPDVVRGNELTFGFFSINSEGELLVSISAGVHCGFGGHVSIAYNLTEALQIIWGWFK